MKEKALKLLRERSRLITYSIIADNTKLTVSWIRAFAREAIPNPGIERIEKLVSYLETAKNACEHSNRT